MPKTLSEKMPAYKTFIFKEVGRRLICTHPDLQRKENYLACFKAT